MKALNLYKGDNGCLYIVRSENIQESIGPFWETVLTSNTGVNLSEIIPFDDKDKFIDVILSTFAEANNWVDSDDATICETEWLTFKKPKHRDFYEAEVIVSDRLRGRKGRGLWGKVFCN